MILMEVEFCNTRLYRQNDRVWGLQLKGGVDAARQGSGWVLRISWHGGREQW